MQSYLRFVQRTGGVRRRLSTLSLSSSDALPRARATSVPTTRAFSGAPKASTFAVVDHSEAYEASMQGPHGRQLALARLEGLGKDDAPFDPFIEEELAALEAREAEKGDEEHVDHAVEANSNEEIYDDDIEEESEEESLYNPDGSVRRKKSVLATLRAGFPSGGQFAVIELGGSQHKVTKDDLIVVNRLKPIQSYSIGSVHTLKDVMLVGSTHMTLVGVPFVAGAEVDVMVEEITRDAKVIVFKKRRRKHSQRKNGFRRDVTLLRVLDVRFPDEYKDHNHVGRELVDALEDQSSYAPAKDTVSAETQARSQDKQATDAGEHDEGSQDRPSRGRRRLHHAS